MRQHVRRTMLPSCRVRCARGVITREPWLHAAHVLALTHAGAPRLAVGPHPHPHPHPHPNQARRVRALDVGPAAVARLAATGDLIHRRGDRRHAPVETSSSLILWLMESRASKLSARSSMILWFYGERGPLTAVPARRLPARAARIGWLTAGFGRCTCATVQPVVLARE